MCECVCVRACVTVRDRWFSKNSQYFVTELTWNHDPIFSSDLLSPSKASLSRLPPVAGLLERENQVIDPWSSLFRLLLLVGQRLGWEFEPDIFNKPRCRISGFFLISVGRSMHGYLAACNTLIHVMVIGDISGCPFWMSSRHLRKSLRSLRTVCCVCVCVCVCACACVCVCVCVCACVCLGGAYCGQQCFLNSLFHQAKPVCVCVCVCVCSRVCVCLSVCLCVCVVPA